MKANYTDKVEPHNDGSCTVQLDSAVVGDLIDYFFFNTDGRPSFDESGMMQGIEGIPKSLYQVIAQVVTVRMDRHDWFDKLREDNPTTDRSELVALAEVRARGGE
jgi:hypothetical protein